MKRFLLVVLCKVNWDMTTRHRVICARSSEKMLWPQNVGHQQNGDLNCTKAKPQTRMVDPQRRYDINSKVLNNTGIWGSSVSVVTDYGFNSGKNKNIPIHNFYLLSEITHVGCNDV